MIAPDLDAWWDAEFSRTPAAERYAAPARHPQNLDLLDGAMHRLLVLAVHYPEAVASVLVTVDPNDLTLHPETQRVLGLLVGRVAPEQVARDARDGELARRVAWASRFRCSSGDPVGEAEGLVRRCVARVGVVRARRGGGA
jgi:hypothetical protein